MKQATADSGLPCSVTKRLPIPARMFLLDGNCLSAYDPAAAKLEPMLAFSPQARHDAMCIA